MYIRIIILIYTYNNMEHIIKHPEQMNEIITVTLPQTNIIWPNKINALVCSNNSVIGSQIYISISEYLKLKEEKQKLEIRIDILQSQINENIQLRHTMDEEITKLKEQLNKQDEKIKILQKIVDEYAIAKLHQKVADNLSNIINNLHNLFCDSDSDICKESGDNNLYYFCDHLIEYHKGTYRKYSKVKKNFSKWTEIYNNVSKILLKEFNITNIEIFFEIVKLVNNRNCMSHNHDPITLDELKLVSQLAQEIYECINNMN